MALIGNCKHVEYIEVDGEFTTETITYTDGTVEEVKQPKMERIETAYENTYTFIYFIQMDRIYFNPEDNTQDNIAKIVHYRYCVYESKEARDANKENYIFTGGEILNNYDYDANVYAQCYNDLTKKEGFEDLIQD